jgi:hypothetical protein
MKHFRCGRCGQLLYFENTVCESCGSALGYLPVAFELVALDPQGGTVWAPFGRPDQPLRYCANFLAAGCNWMVAAGGPAHCRACELNRTIPNLGEYGQAERWRALESEKRRLVYSLLRLGLPLASKATDPERGLAFDFLAESWNPYSESEQVRTGHLRGVITISTAEADSPERERRRTQLDEPYRTIAGHFRHESGHYYWTLLFDAQDRREAFRARFGDERQDYGQALDRYHSFGPAFDWRQGFVSAYASVHPWEDWAETWAHYLHIVDTLETAFSFGVRVGATVAGEGAPGSRADFDPYAEANFDRLLAAWFPLTYAVNSLNRSMGQPDLYPFVLSSSAIEKLRFVHETATRRRQT